ncbi:MAG: pantetheine-phosphate adenylyltransferase [Prevotellaceae bacterium]|jgi:pantetheine-phosphate adenylyltransferase|nr:pantetheine-phosphate adenylyltransferase [Prevotellaceae bacterium]
MTRRAIFPGTFDPFTIGHYSVVLRGLGLFDEIIIAIGTNQTKATMFPLQTRMTMARQAFDGEPHVRVEAYNCMTVDFARQVDAKHILRGIRSVSDFEYEHAIADANCKLTGIETVILFTEYEYSYISSTVVRDLIHYGKDISAFLPPKVVYPLPVDVLK